MRSLQRTIEVVDLSGFRSAVQLESALKEFVQNRNVEVELGYTSDKYSYYSWRKYIKNIWSRWSLFLKPSQPLFQEAGKFVLMNGICFSGIG